MSRLPLTLPAILLLSCVTGVAAQSVRLSTGDTIRVERAVLLSGNASAPGVLMDQRGDTIVMRHLDRAGETRWLLTPTSAVSARRGREPWGIKSGAFAGGLIGGLTATLVAVVTRECRSYYSDFWRRNEEECEHADVTPILVGGVVLGGVLGAVIRKERWVTVGSESVGLGVEVTPTTAVASLRIRF